MNTILITFVIVLLAVIGLSIGALFNNRQITGRCTTTGDDCTCSEAEKQNCDNLIQN